MNKEELINKIVNLSSISLRRESIENLSIEELQELYAQNKMLKYYDGIKKQQMINTIMNFLEDKYNKVQLLSMSYMEVEELFLQTINMTPKQFEDYLDSIIDSVNESSRLEDNEDFQEFDRDEQIIASGALLINPELLLHRIEYAQLPTRVSRNDFNSVFEDKKAEVDWRINEINSKLVILNKSLQEDQEAIKSCRSQEKHELSNDIRATMAEIKMLMDEKQSLMDSLDEYFPRAR